VDAAVARIPLLRADVVEVEPQDPAQQVLQVVLVRDAESRTTGVAVVQLSRKQREPPAQVSDELGGVYSAELHAADGLGDGPLKGKAQDASLAKALRLGRRHADGLKQLPREGLTVGWGRRCGQVLVDEVKKQEHCDLGSRAGLEPACEIPSGTCAFRRQCVNDCGPWRLPSCGYSQAHSYQLVLACCREPGEVPGVAMVAGDGRSR
jgi:hypothetical protein